MSTNSNAVISPSDTINVALVGNPNTGKSTLFGALVGVRQRVGNYPGVTVEKKTGLFSHDGNRFELTDLPGLYSLAPHGRDEMVAVDLLLGRYKSESPVDIVVCIVDASNIERNLYLVSQVMELGLPILVVVNMLDVAKDHGMAIDVAKLSERLAVPVVVTQANRGQGVEKIKDELVSLSKEPFRTPTNPFPQPFQREVRNLQKVLAGHLDSHVGDADNLPPRWLVERLLLDVRGYLTTSLLIDEGGRIKTELKAARKRLAEIGCSVPGIETDVRYGWARSALEGALELPNQYKLTVSDRLDSVLTNRFWGTIVFVLVMVTVFQAVFTWAVPVMALVDGWVEFLGKAVEAGMQEGPLRSLVVDGLLGGVGGVMIFLPQILILFFFIALLEDCGYMARAAFLMDRIMVRVGLSGKSFIPMLSSFACAVPGIMAARVIGNERNRLATILVAPLMTCSARLPIYALLIAAFIPPTSYLGGLISLQGLTLMALYFLGIFTAVLVALLLKKSILRGEPTPFMLELPSYKTPSLRTVFYRVFERGWMFLRTAGTMILLVSIIAWAALYYPHNADVVEAPFKSQLSELHRSLDMLPADAPERVEIVRQIARIDRQIASEYQQQSIIGRMGRTIEPIVKPLGWDWRIGCAVLASFPAREVVVATLGVIYNVGDDGTANGTTEEGFNESAWAKRLRGVTWDGTDRPVFNIPVALSLMTFFALCAQCSATLAVIKTETNSWKWPIFTFVYMTGFAYLGALITYQVGMWMGG